MNLFKKTTLVLFVTLLTIGAVSCSKDDDCAVQEQTPAQILASTAWVTTTVKDQAGTLIPNDDPKAAGYVGYAYYRNDGTFAILSLADVVRMSGTWSVSLDGKTRTLVARNDDGSVRFVRDVQILTLTNNLFIYRITDANGAFDVAHVPTDHKELK